MKNEIYAIAFSSTAPAGRINDADTAIIAVIVVLFAIWLCYHLRPEKKERPSE